MTLVYVTGTSGAGKTTVRAELRRRGFAALDTDEDRLSRWFSNGSGAKVELPADPSDRDDGWYANHTQRIPPRVLRQIDADAGGGLVFICGTAGNEVEIWNLFALVVNLSVDAETIRHRLATRGGNAFGSTDAEAQRILAWNENRDENYDRFGAVRIDATQPVATVVDQLLHVSIETY
ncbi:AAA family ATPase [Tenggerimyces flavus]|uniref:AAA family ATPase n=1 Tax=Tenggerimyces flavus TaxID=1708749 RepID=A0ABV7Y8F2_9ACTN|nr:AAA family ATPase [Tenggerimyces flavus]MBM7783581.1 shikimate kinase [Tenggerimyces flavus]